MRTEPRPAAAESYSASLLQSMPSGWRVAAASLLGSTLVLVTGCGDRHETPSPASAEPSLPMRQATAPVITKEYGERLLDQLAEETAHAYARNPDRALLKLFTIDNRNGTFGLLKGTDLFLSQEHGGPAVIEPLERALAQGAHFTGNDDPFSNLANFPAHPRYREKLLKLLDSPSPAVRVGTTLVLARMPHADLVQPLARLLHDPNLDVRLAAVIAFGPTEEKITDAYVIENEAAVRSLLAEGKAPAIVHPYRNESVHAALKQYLATPIRVGDIPAILQTAANLKMKDLLSLEERIHAESPQMDAFLQQCYRQLEALP